MSLSALLQCGRIRFFFYLVGDGGYLQKVGVAEVLTGVDRVASKLLLNAQELVVLGQALRAKNENGE